MKFASHRYWSVLLTAVCGPAFSAQSVYLDIDPQPINGALYQFAQQSGLQVLFPAEDTLETVVAPRVVGPFRLDVALERLLAGSGLQYEYVNRRTVAIRTGPRKAAAAGPTLSMVLAAESSSPELIPVPRANSTEVSEHEGKSNGVSSVRNVAERTLPEILIRGDRALNVDIRRTIDDIQPYVVFDAEEIASSQSADLEDFFKTHLAMNAASETVGQQANQPNVNRGGINLRGLGFSQTLILIDGRRVPGSTTGGDFFQPNIAGIPLSSIERIEVLPTTASAIYGGSATGGVINIIRKRKYTGFDIQGKYGNSFQSDIGDTQISISGGLSLENGRTHAAFTLAHSESGSLLAAERDFGRRARELLATNSPTSLTSLAEPPRAATGNVCAGRDTLPPLGFYSCNGTPLVLDNGTSLGGTRTSVPAGYAGPTSDGGAALVGNAGDYNLNVPNDGQYLLRSPVRNALSLNVRREFGSRIEAYIDASGERNVSDLSASGTASGTIALPASDPSNPFQQDILVAVQTPDVARPGHSEYEAALVTGGLIAHLPKDWAGTVEGSWSKARLYYEDTTGSALSVEGKSQLSRVALRDIAAYPLDLSSYRLDVPDSFGGPFHTIVRGAAFRVAGPTVKLPSGPVNLSALVEHREEKAPEAFGEDRIISLPFVRYPERSRKVDSYYLEANAPVVAAAQGVPFVRNFDIQVAVRRDEYETHSASVSPRALTQEGPFVAPTYFSNDVASTDYSFGLRYAPISDVTLRASFGTGFLPPNLAQILQQRSTVVIPLPIPSINPPDPRRGNTPLSVPRTVLAVGNPNVQPEESRSWSAGLIFTPHIIDGLRFSIDFTHIKKSSEIFNPTLDFILQNESNFADRVVRGPQRPTDPQAWAGPITLIDVSVLNIASTSVQSYDLRFDYDWSLKLLGDFSISATATRMKELERQLLTTSLPFDAVGYFDGPLEWRGNAGLTWARGPWSASWVTSYFDSYLVSRSSRSITPAQNSTFIVNQGSASIPSQLYHDASVSFRFEGWSAFPFKNSVVSLGVQNVFDKDPPIIAAASLLASERGYSAYGDPRLRRFTLSIQTTIGD